MYRIRKLEPGDWFELLRVYADCFVESKYYRDVFQKRFKSAGVLTDDMLRNYITVYMGPVLQDVIGLGQSYGAIVNGALVGFLLGFDYHDVLKNDENLFMRLFGDDGGGNLRVVSNLHKPVQALPGQTYYGLSIGVLLHYRRQGIASDLLAEALKNHAGWNFASDVNNTASLGMYKRQGCDVMALDTDWFLVFKKG